MDKLAAEAEEAPAASVTGGPVDLADAEDEADLALRFTLSHPVTAAVPPGDPVLFDMAVRLAKEFRPITPDQEKALKAKAAAGTPLFRYPSKDA